MVATLGHLIIRLFKKQPIIRISWVKVKIFPINSFCLVRALAFYLLKRVGLVNSTVERINCGSCFLLGSRSNRTIISTTIRIISAACYRPNFINRRIRSRKITGDLYEKTKLFTLDGHWHRYYCWNNGVWCRQSK